MSNTYKEVFLAVLAGISADPNATKIIDHCKWVAETVTSDQEIMAKIQNSDPQRFTSEEAAVICDLIFKHGEADSVHLGIMDKCAKIVKTEAEIKEPK